MILDELKALDRPQRAAFVASLLGWSLDAFDFFTLVFVVSDIAKAFDAKVSTVSLAIALTLMARPVGAFLFGWLADRYGRRPVLMINVLLFAGLAFASGFAPTLPVLIGIRLLFGIAMGGEWGVGSSLAMESIPPKSRGVVSGFLQGGYPFGYLLASLAYLFIDHIGWRGMLMLGAVPALLVMYIRREVPESPAFRSVQAEAAAARAAKPQPGRLAPGERREALQGYMSTLLGAGLPPAVMALFTGPVRPVLVITAVGLAVQLAVSVAAATRRRPTTSAAVRSHQMSMLRTVWLAVAAAAVGTWVVWSVSGSLKQLGLRMTDVAEGGAALLSAWFLLRSVFGMARAFAGRALGETQPGTFFGSLERAWPRLVYLALLMTAFNVFSHGTHDLYPTFLKTERGFPPVVITTLTVLGNVGAILGGALFGALSERVGRRPAIAGAALLALPFIPLWAFGATPLLLALGGFVVNMSVQGAWGVVPVHLNELSPAQARSTFPGFTYQIGNLMASGITVLQAGVAEARGGAHPDFGFAQAVTVGGIALVVAGLAWFGPEAKGVDLVRAGQPPAD